jgi:glutamine---fructose-6-phosphate transaminase (isomerizing)
MTSSETFAGYEPLIGSGSRLGKDGQALLIALREEEREAAAGIPADAPLDPYRRRRVELTLEEMRNQPQAITDTLEREAGAIRNVAEHFTKRHLGRVYLIGCGDSLSSGIAVRPWFESLLGVPCEALQALDYGHYLYHLTNSETALVAISSSGATPRTVEALMRARSRGALTVGISNTRESALIRESNFGLYVHAERKGWPTQASTAAMALLYSLGTEIGRARGIDVREARRELGHLPEVVAEALGHFDAPMAKLGAELANKPVFLFAAAGQSWATAQFGAAKVRECTTAHAVPIHLEEFHHYNSQKAGDPLFVIAPYGPTMSRACDTVRAGKAWGGMVYLLTASDQIDDHLADLVLTLPPVSEAFSPLVYVVPLQLFAYHLAVAQFAEAESAI